MTLPDIRIQNTGAVQKDAPFTFAQVFAVGDLMPGEGLVGKLADGSTIPLQVDQKATHGDGSVRHAIISGALLTLAKGATAKFDLVKAGKAPIPTTPFPPTQLSARVMLVIEGQAYTADMPKLTSAYEPWLFGSIVCEGFIGAPLKNAAGVEHPLLTIRYGVRWYKLGPARIEVVVENAKTWKATSNFTYDVLVEVNGKVVYNKVSLTHYQHSRWHMYAWSDAAPFIHVQHNAAYLIASKAVSNYDQSIVIPEDVLAGMGQALTPDNTGPMKVGTVVPYMGMTGGRGDIGPLPDYAVNYLLSMDNRAYAVMMANADGSGTWPIHMRDEDTGKPVRTDNVKNALITTHGNMSDRGPLPVPRSIPGAPTDCPYDPDVAHHPSLNFLPYVLTGDLYYLEELQFWAASNPLGTDPGNNGYGKGLVRWHQVRGQAWSLRTLGHAAYITPDDSPMKEYFTNQVENNLSFYHQTYVVGNPNKLGAYDGSGEGTMYLDASPPWQDDFLTWSFGYLAELGFSKAQPILDWKAKYSIGRMTASGFCWIAATSYTLAFRRTDNGKIFDTFAEMYEANFNDPKVGYKIRSDDGGYRDGPPGVKYFDLPCGSAEQAAYLQFVNGGWGWPVGKMMGYSDGPLGYAANMQPGLSVAVTTNNPNAKKAWEVFMGRAGKPDYTRNPQWNIIPRAAVDSAPVPLPAPVPPVIVPPVVVPIPPVPPVRTGKITTPSSSALVALMKSSKTKQFGYQVFDIGNFNVVKEFKSIAPSSKGVFTLIDLTLYVNKKRQLAGKVLDASGKVLLVHYPLTVI